MGVALHGFGFKWFLREYKLKVQGVYKPLMPDRLFNVKIFSFFAKIFYRFIHFFFFLIVLIAFLKAI